MSDELLLNAPAVYPKDSQGNYVAIKTRAGLVVLLDGSNVEAEIAAVKSAPAVRCLTTSRPATSSPA